MKIGYGKNNDVLKTPYRVIKDVLGIDITLENGYEINIREHGYRISKNGKTVENVDFVKEEQ